MKDREFVIKKIQRTKPARIQLQLKGEDPISFDCSEVSGQEIGASLDRLPWARVEAYSDADTAMWIYTPDSQDPEPETDSKRDDSGSLKLILMAQREILGPLANAYKVALESLQDAMKTQATSYKSLLALVYDRVQIQAETEVEALNVLREQEPEKPSELAQLAEALGPAVVELMSRKKDESKKVDKKVDNAK